MSRNVAYIHIENISPEQLKDLITYSPALSASSLSTKEYISLDVMNFNKVTETKQQTNQVLQRINKSEKETGDEIQEVEFEDLKISKNELKLKDLVLQGIEYYYKTEFQKSIEWYDKAPEVDPNNISALYNKGAALYILGKYNKAIELYDKALEIDPEYSLPKKGKQLAFELLEISKGKEKGGFFSKYFNKN